MEVSKIDSGDQNRFKFPVYKTVKDKNGVEFEVLDREDVHTLAGLQEQRQVYVDMIAAIDAKIEAITNLK